MENEPTILTQKDVEEFLKDIIDGKHDPKKKTCFKCEKKYFQNYGDHLCDECYFAQFPKDVVEKFYKSFF